MASYTLRLPSWPANKKWKLRCREPGVMWRAWPAGMLHVITLYLPRLQGVPFFNCRKRDTIVRIYIYSAFIRSENVGSYVFSMSVKPTMAQLLGTKVIKWSFLSRLISKLRFSAGCGHARDFRNMLKTKTSSSSSALSVHLVLRPNSASEALAFYADGAKDINMEFWQC